MREIILQLLTLLIPFCLIGSVTGFECYKTDGISMKLRSQYCNPVSQPYCLKAMVYDGRVIRDCASAQQCPQGDGCAPITYDEDGTTDFVCCCMSALCNSSPALWPSTSGITVALSTALMLGALATPLILMR